MEIASLRWETGYSSGLGDSGGESICGGETGWGGEKNPNSPEKRQKIGQLQVHLAGVRSPGGGGEKSDGRRESGKSNGKKKLLRTLKGRADGHKKKKRRTGDLAILSIVFETKVEAGD